MNEKVNYLSDEELEQLILQVEQKELVSAPPDLMEIVLDAAARKKEFYAYCFRVVTSAAAAIALVFLLPELSGWMKQKVSPDFVQTVYKQTVPAYEIVVEQVPGKDEVLATQSIPSKEEVLNDTGFMERVISSTGWFGKESNDN